METPDRLPISMLNQISYCQRRFWLMFVQGEMAVNAPVLEGIQQHRRAHESGVQREGDLRVYRRVYVWSDALRLTGFADVVEERDGRLTPVEYKRGRMGRWLNDHIQLCAQALCLEERLQEGGRGRRIERGEIFYWRSRRRVEVAIDDGLRAKTRETVAHAFDLLAAGRMPPPLAARGDGRPPRCHDCSLETICLPREVTMLTQEGDGG